MNEMKVIISSRFEIELIESCWYIEYNLGNPKAAVRLYSKVMKAIDKLKYSPYANPRIYELDYGDYRIIFVNKYVIVYKVVRELGQIYVLHIFHSSQNYLGLI